MNIFHVKQAARCLWRGGVIAYPTEAVWGLGCNPFDQTACLSLLQIKQRPVEKGMILVAADCDQIDYLLRPLTREQVHKMQSSWPGPTTWLIPDFLDQIPWWVKGRHSSIAVRVSNHPLVVSLCREFGGPLVSTSANKADQRPARNRLQIAKALESELDYVLPGRLGKEQQVSRIIDLQSGRILR